ncbi:hypothetical protein CI102_14502, partial [Trichoderma harzianum]
VLPASGGTGSFLAPGVSLGDSGRGHDGVVVRARVQGSIHVRENLVVGEDQVNAPSRVSSGGFGEG